MPLTAAIVPTRHRSVAGVSRTARVVRLLVAMLCVLVVAACGDSSGPSVPVEGTYNLYSIEGVLVPATDPSGALTVQSGTLRLDGQDWDLTIVTSGEDIIDFGTYDRSGSSIEFASDRFGDFFDGRLSNGNRTLRAEYELPVAGVATLEFRR